MKCVWQILSLNSNLASNIILTMNRKSAFLNAQILSSLMLLLCFNSFLFSQKKEIDARNISTSEFPKVSGSLWVRDPKGIDTKDISFYENDKPVQLNFETFQKSDSIAKNKTIVFLIQNTSNKTVSNWYKEVVLNAVKNNGINKGDRVEIMFFGLLKNNQASYPLKLSFTDDITEIESKLNSVEDYKKYSSNGASHTYIAINEALDLLDSATTNQPSGIFVLSNNQSLTSKFEVETPYQKARKLDIPIYAITYKKGNPIHPLDVICKETYGVFYNDESNSVSICSDKLADFLTDFQKRHAGLYYPFTYTSSYEKDGQTHEVKIDSKKGQTIFSLAVPTKSIIERIKENPLVSLLIFIVLIGLIVVIVMLYKKHKLKQAELEEQRKREMKEVEEKQKLAEQKLSQQDQEIQRIQQEEKRQQEEEIRKRQAEGQQIDDEAQLQKMLERGNFPWFEYKFGADSGSYQIQTPRLSVGRDTNNVWTINHPTVSKNHFKLTFKDYVYTLEDLGSTNGTFVNGYKISQTIINHGDCIQIGDITLTIHI
jgi:hypothetical protein